jgi:hypothetical protein
MTMKKIVHILLTAGLAFTLLGVRPLVREANAIIGRPLTPLSFAGVARRTTRRAIAFGGYGGYGGYYAPPPYAYPYW